MKPVSDMVPNPGQEQPLSSTCVAAVVAASDLIGTKFRWVLGYL